MADVVTSASASACSVTSLRPAAARGHGVAADDGVEVFEGPTARTATDWPRVDAVLLSWRAAEKTVQALRALATCGYPNLRVIVVDNGSDDGSDAATWAELHALFPGAQRVDVGVRPVAGACPDGALFLRSAVNRGYSGGMNLGLDVIQRSAQAAYFWTINNDTLAAPGVVQALVARCEEDPAVGLCGVTQHVTDVDGTFRFTLAGGFEYRRARGLNVRLLAPAEVTVAAREDVERRMFGVGGSAVFGPRRFLDEAGLFGTDRFLYGEEHELAARARRAGFRLAWAPDAVVHTVHDSTLEEVPDGARTTLTRYLGARARIRYALVHDRWFLPLVAGAQLGQAAADLLHGRRRAAWGGVSGLIDGLSGRHKVFTQLGAAMYPGTVRA